MNDLGGVDDASWRVQPEDENFPSIEPSPEDSDGHGSSSTAGTTPQSSVDLEDKLLHHGVTNDLWGERGLEYLNIIDKLRSHEHSLTSDIPQLVVCGNTSAGKSSVLEALTNIDFPKSGVMCTSFVTELVTQLYADVKSADQLPGFVFAERPPKPSTVTSCRQKTRLKSKKPD